MRPQDLHSWFKVVIQPQNLQARFEITICDLKICGVRFEVAISDLNEYPADIGVSGEFPGLCRLPQERDARAYILGLGDAYFCVGPEHFAQGFADFAYGGVGSHCINYVRHGVRRRDVSV